MRVLVHDSSGHPFQIELSRELARRGHEVRHIYCSSFLSPRGEVHRQPDDSEGFVIKDVALARPFERFSMRRYSYARRLLQEFTYGNRVAREVADFRPDVVISANGPLFSQRRIERGCRSAGIPFVLWLQDFYSLPMKAEAERRLGLVGTAVGSVLEAAEQYLARRCRFVVTISEDFNLRLTDWGVDPQNILTIENWAPIQDLPVRPKVNDWSVAHDLSDRTVFVYTGTLGLKHNPELLWALARRVGEQDPRARVVVASEGTGMDYLRERRQTENLDQLVLLPFQPFDRYADVLGTADVLVAILEPGAGAYAVPSKVLSYLCAQRPILAAIPGSNLAGRIVLDNEAGLVVNPNDEEGLVCAAAKLLGDPQTRAELGRNGRRYAEANFPIGVIADKFELLLLKAAASQGVR